MGILHQHLMKRAFTFISGNDPVVITLCDIRAQEAGANASVLSLCNVESTLPTGSGGGGGGGNTPPTLQMEDVSVAFPTVTVPSPPTFDFTGTDAEPWIIGNTYDVVCETNNVDTDNVTAFTITDDFVNASVLSVEFFEWTGASWTSRGASLITPHSYQPASGLGTGDRWKVEATYAVGPSQPDTSIITILCYAETDGPASGSDSTTKEID